MSRQFVVTTVEISGITLLAGYAAWELNNRGLYGLAWVAIALCVLLISLLREP